VSVLTFLRRHLLKRPSHATVVAYIALFFAMSGTAYATVQWTGANIADGSLTGADVQNGSLTTSDLAAGTVSSGGTSTATLDIPQDPSVTWYRGTVDENNNPISQAAPGPVIATIPDVGELFVAGCDEVTQPIFGLRNTTGTTLYGITWADLPSVDDRKGNANSHDTVPTGSELRLIESSQVMSWLIVSGDGAGAPVTHLTAQAVVVQGESTCRFVASWN
jgi:hypothetical protein